MVAHCYILFSEKLNRYYIGATTQVVAKRLEMHITKHYGNRKYTAKADDWQIFDSIAFKTITEARKAEKYLKQMRNRHYYLLLKTDFQARNRFINKFAPQSF